MDKKVNLTLNWECGYLTHVIIQTNHFSLRLEWYSIKINGSYDVQPAHAFTNKQEMFTAISDACDLCIQAYIRCG